MSVEHIGALGTNTTAAYGKQKSGSGAYADLSTIGQDTVSFGASTKEKIRNRIKRNANKVANTPLKDLA